MTKANQILAFYEALSFDRKYLDADLNVLNPFEGASQEQNNALEGFYGKFYSDNKPRNLILGINPGRLGAGATGIPFTDTKRLLKCGIPFNSFSTHEPSSVFVYEAIDAYGGAEKFYDQFFIGSVCPLGFVIRKNGNWINFNYYDRTSFANALAPYLLEQIEKQIELAGKNERIIVFGTGKNLKFLDKLNKEYNFTPELVALEHPRYVMQYKYKHREQYIAKYLEALSL
ncbi:MAG: DUF4918 domain-containing protein [Flavobacteriales bacterium]|jgi:hypothetical protein|nr:DUF4918 domain-containing protein [Flavobacteriales bacterium]